MCEILFVPFKIGCNYFPQFCGAPEIKPLWPLKPKLWKLIFPVQDP
jgi:hypothetical protein